jgi:hypothetical protein
VGYENWRFLTAHYSLALVEHALTARQPSLASLQDAGIRGALEAYRNARAITADAAAPVIDRLADAPEVRLAEAIAGVVADCRASGPLPAPPKEGR